MKPSEFTKEMARRLYLVEDGLNKLNALKNHVKRGSLSILISALAVLSGYGANSARLQVERYVGLCGEYVCAGEVGFFLLYSILTLAATVLVIAFYKNIVAWRGGE